MKTMEQYAKEYQHLHKNEGVVSNVTEYSFLFTEYTKKPTDKPVSYTVMLGWFWEA